jgi:polysaccharide pyruvyl transferase WcaK-like protein
MLIEVRGIGPTNKGALLMLEALKAQVHQRWPSARIAVPATMPVEQRLAMGLWTLAPRERGPVDLSGLAEVVPQRLRNSVGVVAPSEIDVVLDASGFAFGDFWGAKKLKKRLGRPLAKKKGRRPKTILLPQALGPFTAPGMAEGFRTVLQHADLIFARDKQSLQHVRALQPDADNVRLAPDFTNLLHPELPARLEHLKGWSYVIPNEKVISGADAEKEAVYLRFLVAAAERLVAAGKRTALLIHEGQGDLKLANRANAELAAPLPIINEPSPLVTKAVISQAELVVSSRFHGLVSALSSGVPALACGWSHKYGELLSDYGCERFNLLLGNEPNSSTLIDAFISEVSGSELQRSIATSALQERSRSIAMWDQVFQIVEI